MDTIWEHHKTIGDLLADAQRLQLELAHEIKKHPSRSGHISSNIETFEREQKQLTENIKELNVKLDRLSADTKTHQRKIDTLRNERYALQMSLKRKELEISVEREYVAAMRRMTVYTRTRSDYERTLLRLTSEQKQVLDRISLNTDFLIKGRAGTGKTLVLLKAIEKALGKGEQKALEIQELHPSVSLLTYTKALAKYDRYLAGILPSDIDADVISTVHAFLRKRINEADSCYHPENNDSTCIEICSPYATSSMSAQDILGEIKTFIWAHAVTRKEYLDEMIERKGMEKPLQAAARNTVWQAKEALEKYISETGCAPFQHFPIRLMQLLDDEKSKALIRRFDHICIDEAQDLTAATLQALKRLATRSVILAGDADQSIYQMGFSFQRAGLDIKGRSYILKTNFRNTVQIHHLAERFKGSSICESQEYSAAFKEGPLPELHQAPNSAALIELMTDRVSFFTKQLEYDLENICVLTPSKNDFPVIIQALTDKNIKSGSIRDDNFAFDESTSGIVRLSTLHSAKGLDFPVVLLYLPNEAKGVDGYNEETNAGICRNLVYVAMTRAMDHLQVFTLDNPDSRVIADLVECFSLT
ncbi:MAG: UvrD-helicase domain-containing protein [Spirochaetales bacterium]|nr:UvrD-helicase domain-containing protein [Spirochaetales bacterium]